MFIVPQRLAATCRGLPERRAWLDRLPDVVRQLQDRWTLTLGAPFDGSEVSCAWVAPALRGDGVNRRPCPAVHTWQESRMMGLSPCQAPGLKELPQPLVPERLDHRCMLARCASRDKVHAELGMMAEFAVK